MTNFNHYLPFADLLRYPDENYPEIVNHCIRTIQKNYPEAAGKLQPFADYINTHNRDEREELYTKTFDVQPICYLDLGYVIWGEDYKRGAFLLHMQQEQGESSE